MARHRSMKSRARSSNAARAVLAVLAFVALGLTLTRILPTGGSTTTLQPVLAAYGTAPPWETSLPSGEEIGGLAFYNSSGQVITGGNLADAPISAYALASASSLSTDTKATLYACTPQVGVDPTSWTGCEQLSGSTNYPPGATAPSSLRTTTLPVVTGASTDRSLQTFITQFPNTLTQAGYQNMYQLRVVTSGFGHAVDASTAYNAADLSVVASTWVLSYSPATPSPSATATPSPQPTTSASATVSASPSAPAPTGTAPSASASSSSVPSPSPTITSTPPPWETAAAKAEEVGGLGFYTATGATMTGGNLSDHPLAPYVLAGAPSHLSGDVKATLYACTPEFQTDPSSWQGCQQLSLSTSYPPPTSVPSPLNATGLPIVTGAASNRSLETFITQFPNTLTQAGYQNMYQLRVATSGPGQAADPGNAYDEADILVTGAGTSATWRVVFTSSVPDPAAVARPTPCGTGSVCPAPSASATPAVPGTLIPTSGTATSTTASQTTIPTTTSAPIGVQIADSSGNLLGSDPELRPGDRITVRMSGFFPYENISVTLHSLPVTEPAVVSNIDGQATYPFTVPASLPAGAHTLVFQSTSLTQSVPFTIGAGGGLSGALAAPISSSKGLPFTGANLLTPTLLGACALWSGLVLLVLGRRQLRSAPTGGRHRHGSRRLV